jgi:hypothetical protein
MSNVHDSNPRDDTPHTTDAPDELSSSMAAFLADVYATPDDLTEAELQELALAEDERLLSDEIHRAIVSTRRLSDVLAELGFPARVAV